MSSRALAVAENTKETKGSYSASNANYIKMVSCSKRDVEVIKNAQQLYPLNH